ncbi:uroporphyrinogen-III synthase [Ancylobacter sp. MQZ15Z-1]|uniref:Uroporphyrinogen-III synthase n=1 Tax=Ancylobacter mangrovi TaxID=2972472 RepID=A0A9X2PHA6_9HYPH|nr:uroporphyrinogen-III synthase [Ancylobacter mangrovi]MCS0497404.1 uroporphyrinogen-III synthase [Ancylobacter mangrovi]
MAAAARVLVTRPAPDAEATAGRLRAAGFAAVVDPMLVVEPLPGASLPEGRFDAVALTSVNGARLLAGRAELAGLRALPLYAVGRRTAVAAPAGFAATRVAGGSGATLAELLRAELPSGTRLLHVAGEDRAVDLGAELAEAGIDVGLFVIYRAVPARVLAPATIAAIEGGQVGAAFHFSPRTAATLAERAHEAGVAARLAEVEHLCFSAGVAAPLRTAGWRTRIAATPSEEGLFALLKR